MRSTRIVSKSMAGDGESEKMNIASSDIENFIKRDDKGYLKVDDLSVKDIS